MAEKNTECRHCGLKPLPCPICGKPGKIWGPNNVGCSDLQCGAWVDWEHFCRTDDNGVPAEHYVIQQWNRRVAPEASATAVWNEAIEAAKAKAAYWGEGKWRVKDEPGRSRYDLNDLQTYTNIAGRGIAQDIESLKREAPVRLEEASLADEISPHKSNQPDTEKES